MELLLENPRAGLDTPLEIDSLTTRFGAAWWERFMAETGQLSAPQAFRACLDAGETARMRRCILDIIAELGSTIRNAYGYRLWIEGEQVTDLDAHFAKAPRPGEDIEDWTRRAFGDQHFGIILNRGEKFNMELSRAMAYVLKPMMERAGMPTEGIIFTIFIGNYDMTPLGIHKDLPGKSVIHFHLGPGSKTMYVWDDDKYETAPGEKRQNNKAVEPHLASATRHTFHEGDLYFMPENRFHLGTQSGLSIGIACWFNNRSNIHFAQRLVQLLRQNYLHDSGTMLRHDRRPVDDIGHLEQTLDQFDLSEVGEASVKDTLRHIYKDFRYALFSNAGFRSSPFPNLAPAGIREDSRVRVTDPYRILARETDAQGEMTLYMRGTKVAIRELGGVRALVDALNAGRELAMAEVLALLGAPWTFATARYLLELMHKHRGIQIR